MALFGTRRDMSFINHINNELLNDIISQQVSIYKQKLSETSVNIYGESSNEKFWDGPYLFSCLINKSPQDLTYQEVGISFTRTIEIAFYNQHLEDSGVVIEIGDIILFDEGYYEIEGLVKNQFFAGKDPNYPNDKTCELSEYIDWGNPLNPGLDGFGKSISTVCRAHYVPADKLSISPYKERM